MAWPDQTILGLARILSRAEKAGRTDATRFCWSPFAIIPHTEPRRTRSIRWRRSKISLCLREKIRRLLPLLLDFEKRLVRSNVFLTNPVSFL